MLRKTCKKLPKRGKEMSDVAYAQSLFKEAFPKSRYGKLDALLYEAYRFLKPRVEPRIQRPFTIRRCETLHRGTARRVDGAELEALKAAQIEELKRERTETISRLAVLEEALAVAGPVSAGETMVPHSEDAHPLG